MSWMCLGAEMVLIRCMRERRHRSKAVTTSGSLDQRPKMFAIPIPRQEMTMVIVRLTTIQSSFRLKG